MKTRAGFAKKWIAIQFLKCLMYDKSDIYSYCYNSLRSQIVILNDK